VAVTHWRDERKAIEAHFNTGWAGATTIQWENVEPAEVLTSAHVALSIRRGEGQQVSLGDSPDLRFVGVVAVQIFGPSGQGPAPVELLADKAAGIFMGTNGKRLQIASGSEGLITFGIPSVSETKKSGGFWTLTVMVPFTRDQRITQ
jgi:hypothetical protein